MQVIARRPLKDFWTRHPQAEAALTAWFDVVEAAAWSAPADVRETFNSVDFVGDHRVVFNVGGNEYRIVGRVSYVYKNVLIKFVGTHVEYDAINAATVGKP